MGGRLVQRHPRLRLAGDAGMDLGEAAVQAHGKEQLSERRYASSCLVSPSKVVNAATGTRRSGRKVVTTAKGTGAESGGSVILPSDCTW